MDFFGRRRKRPDKQFPELSSVRADQMRHQLRADFAARDYDCTIDGYEVRLSRRGSAEITSLNVADLVEAIARDDDPDSVTAWTRNFVKAAMAVDFADNPDTQDTYRAVRMLLLRSNDEQPGVGRATVREVTEDLSACLVFDTGEAVTPANVATVTKLDDLATIERAALGNLRRELNAAELDMSYHSDDEAQAGCWVISARGPYLAGAPLILADFLADRMPELSVEDGVLFGIPLPNILLMREVTHGEDLAGALHMIATGTLGLAEHADMVGTISPRVYLWYGGLLEPVSSVTDDGGYLIEPNSYLMGRLQG